ncbi:SPRY domain-containing protein 3-like [Mercenaria mercenaria]|uniref:SPRY domain-containing protein 3-like n=1 Tax=Mercenaria mercenaria TaxID=6596 RepID=UPI00234F23A4|nr:SPRY domain-containing protein 3-like [Mercenaria mercenaria]
MFTPVVGFVPENYPKHIQLGFGRNSIGYSLCYGGLYFEHDSVKDFGPKCNVGDRIHCEIRKQEALKPYNTELNAFFVRNGEVVLKQKIYSAISTGTNVQRYPAIELHYPGQKVKVVTDHMDIPRS